MYDHFARTLSPCQLGASGSIPVPCVSTFCLHDYHVANSSLTQLQELQELQLQMKPDQYMQHTENLSTTGLPHMPHLTKLVLNGDVSTGICLARAVLDVTLEWWLDFQPCRGVSGFMVGSSKPAMHIAA
jgi:hypothetical protein